MTLLLLFAFIAGVVTILSPCVLPVLPVVLSTSVAGGKWRPWGVVTGFLASFSAATLTLSALVRAFGFSADLLRYISAAIIVLFALVLIVPAAKDRFMVLASTLVSRGNFAPRRGDGHKAADGVSGKDTKTPAGFFAGFLTGVSLGIVWTPCVGPIMASVITMAAGSSVDGGAVLITLAYSLGTSVPLFAVMQGGRAMVTRFPGLSRNLSSLQRGFGIAMLLAGVAIFIGWDRQVQTFLLHTFPSYGAGLTAIENRPEVRGALDARAGFDSGLEAGSETGSASSSASESDTGAGKEDAIILDFSGTDPLSRTSGSWFNSPPLTLASLRGSVVMVDFWTYSCINCQRTLPWINAWHERYARDGLVLVGVHTPEFAFEREAKNLRRAMDELGVKHPVVQDNDFGIWNAFSNRYWPSHYIFDRDGTLVSSHFGEGAYEETEDTLRRLLGVSPDAERATPPSAIVKSPERNPETYLGSARSERLGSARPGETGEWKLPLRLGRYEWGLEGAWKQAAEYVEAGSSGILDLDFRAREIFVVASLPDGSTGTLKVTVKGKALFWSEANRITKEIVVDKDSLYTLFSTEKSTKGVLRIQASPGVRLHAFTFS